MKIIILRLIGSYLKDFSQNRKIDVYLIFISVDKKVENRKNKYQVKSLEINTKCVDKISM